MLATKRGRNGCGPNVTALEAAVPENSLLVVVGALATLRPTSAHATVVAQANVQARATMKPAAERRGRVRQQAQPGVRVHAVTIVLIDRSASLPITNMFIRSASRKLALP